jgi:hypothetical protein
MANDPLPGENPGQLLALLDRWTTSLDLHARYAALDDERYWHVQPWPKHERPQRWIIQLARKRILALKRLVTQRLSDGDREFIEGIETMGFLASLIGLTSLERNIPLATHETERREVLAAKADPAARRAGETTRQMPALPDSRAERAPAAPRPAPVRPAVPAKAAVHSRPATPPRPVVAPRPALAAPPPARREVRRDAQRPAAVRPKKAPATISQQEHVVIADAVRLLGWGREWHELTDMITRLAERPPAAEIRRILKTYHNHIEAIVSRRRE